MRCCVVNFANGSYLPGQARLKESLIKIGFPEKDIFLFQHIDQLINKGITTPSHSVVPYGFKLSCIEYARRLGYEKILWCDASVWTKQSLDTIWKWMDNHEGFYVQFCGAILDRFCNDNGLKLLNIDRKEAKTIPIWQGTAMGLDFTKPKPFEFFRKWLDMAKRGGFKGSWAAGDGAAGGHRHDQTMGSGLLYKMYGDKYRDIVCPSGIAKYIGGLYGAIETDTILCIRGAVGIPQSLWYSDE